MELEENLTPTKDCGFELGRVRSVTGREISRVHQQGRRAWRVHLLLYAPTFEGVHGIPRVFGKLGSKPNSDVRPQIGVSARELTARLLEIDDACRVVSAYIWAPLYWVLGAKS